MDPCETCKKYGFTRDHECHYPISDKGLNRKILEKNHEIQSKFCGDFQYFIYHTKILIFAHYEKRRTKYYSICQETCSKSLRCTAFAFQPTSSDLNAKGNDCYFFDFNDDTKLVCDGLSEKIVQGERKG